jgi:dynein light intermediate chain 2, cytosolic
LQKSKPQAYSTLEQRL